MTESKLLILSIDEWDRLTKLGDESLNAIYGGPTKSKKFISGKDAYEAQCLDFPNATPWDGVAEDIQHRYRRIANELNKRLQAA